MRFIKKYWAMLVVAGAFWFLGVKMAIQEGASHRFFSELPQGVFPGLQLRDSDFLIPLNRLMLTGYVQVDDPQGHYGTVCLPENVMLFRIAEEDDIHSFVLWGAQERTLSEWGEIRYLGKNITIEKAGFGEDGTYEVIYKTEAREISNRCSFVASRIWLGSWPNEEEGTAVKLVLNGRSAKPEQNGRK